MDNRHRRIINQLRLIARDIDPIGSARIAAAITYRGKIVSIGINQRKSHPFQAKYGKNDKAIYFHAEVNVIHNALQNTGDADFLRKCSLYVVRQKYHEGKWVDGLAKPCSGCMRAISVYNINNIYYTT